MRFCLHTLSIAALLLAGLGTLAAPQPVLGLGNADIPGSPDPLRDGLDAPGSPASAMLPVEAELRERQ